MTIGVEILKWTSGGSSDWTLVWSSDFEGSKVGGT